MTGHSEQLDQLATALVAAQSELRNMVPDATGHVGKEGAGGRDYGYVSLARLLDEVRPILTKHGLALLQTSEPGDPASLRLSTTLLHQSGQYVTGTVIMPLVNSTPQGVGSATTYARRYCAAAIIGVAAEVDDDAALGSKARTSRQPPANRENAHKPVLLDEAFMARTMDQVGADPQARGLFYAALKQSFGWSHDLAAAKLGFKSFGQDAALLTVRTVLMRCTQLYESERN